jgi:hypothetical protein
MSSGAIASNIKSNRCRIMPTLRVARPRHSATRSRLTGRPVYRLPVTLSDVVLRFSAQREGGNSMMTLFN